MGTEVDKISATPEQDRIGVSHSSDIRLVQRAARRIAAALGFDETASEEIALCASELASNQVAHAAGGTVTLTRLIEGGRRGIQLDAQDNGPGIVDVQLAMKDGFSKAGSLGYGLGTINRFMDECDIQSASGVGSGTRVIARRWIKVDAAPVQICPLEVGAATRPHVKSTLNGDAFVVKRWGESVLVAAIDGLGHGRYAHRAAMVARDYTERHKEQPLAAIFRGAGIACRATQGVVMALARFDWGRAQLSFASIGNVEARVIGGAEVLRLLARRGVVGMNAPSPHVTEHHWRKTQMLVLHTDGVSSRWQWEDFRHLANQSATVIAQQLLRQLAKDDDDATVMVVKARGG